MIHGIDIYIYIYLFISILYTIYRFLYRNIYQKQVKHPYRFNSIFDESYRKWLRCRFSSMLPTTQISSRQRFNRYWLNLELGVLIRQNGRTGGGDGALFIKMLLGIVPLPSSSGQ